MYDIIAVVISAALMGLLFWWLIKSTKKEFPNQNKLKGG